MIQIKFPKEYSYFWEIIKAVLNNKPFPIDEINLVGGRKSAKTTTIMLAMAFLALATTDCAFFAWRYNKQDAEELMDDFIITLNSYEIPFVVKNRNTKICFPNGSYIRVLGAHTQSKSRRNAIKSGLAKFGNKKYCFVLVDERFEFPEVAINALKEAIRSIDPELIDVHYLWALACNPWSKGSPYIQYCSRYQGWNVNLLKTVGSQCGIYEEVLEGGIKIRKMFHYTNWRVAKEFLPAGDIKQILDTWNTDKKRASTVDWGLPGYEEGAIYTHLLGNISKAIYQEHEILFGGGDYGWGNDSSSGKTVFHFGGYTANDAIDVYNEYVQCNYEIAKDPNRVAREVIDFYSKSMQEYASRIGWAAPFPIKIRVDNMAVGFIQILNNIAKQMGCRWLQFVRCSKFPIQDRISIVQSQMAKQKLRLSDKVILLKQEFEMSYYEKTLTQKRAKVNDHAINAFEYGIEPFMYRLARENGLTEIAFKKARIN